MFVVGARWSPKLLVCCWRSCDGSKSSTQSPKAGRAATPRAGRAATRRASRASCKTTTSKREKIQNRLTRSAVREAKEDCYAKHSILAKKWRCDMVYKMEPATTQNYLKVEIDRRAVCGLGTVERFGAIPLSVLRVFSGLILHDASLPRPGNTNHKYYLAGCPRAPPLHYTTTLCQQRGCTNMTARKTRCSLSKRLLYCAGI